MTDISKELGISMDLHQSGAPILVEADEQGVRRSRLQMAEEMQAMGAGGYRDIYALSEQRLVALSLALCRARLLG